MCPVETDAQRLGRRAEAAFAAAVTARGHRWEKTSAGNDFGIDGRVELVTEHGSVSGTGFGVQIKGTKVHSFNADGSLAVRPVKMSTVSYWFKRVEPTLLV